MYGGVHFQECIFRDAEQIIQLQIIQIAEQIIQL